MNELDRIEHKMVSPSRILWSPAVLEQRFEVSLIANGVQWLCPGALDNLLVRCLTAQPSFATCFHYQHLLRETHQLTVASLKELLPCHGFPPPSVL
jgi:hypothetical protein